MRSARCLFSGASLDSLGGVKRASWYCSSGLRGGGLWPAGSDSPIKPLAKAMGRGPCSTRAAPEKRSFRKVLHPQIDRPLARVGPDTPTRLARELAWSRPVLLPPEEYRCNIQVVDWTVSKYLTFPVHPATRLTAMPSPLPDRHAGSHQVSMMRRPGRASAVTKTDGGALIRRPWAVLLRPSKPMAAGVLEPLRYLAAAFRIRSTSPPGLHGPERSWPAMTAGTDQSIMFW